MYVYVSQCNQTVDRIPEIMPQAMNPSHLQHSTYNNANFQQPAFNDHLAPITECQVVTVYSIYYVIIYAGKYPESRELHLNLAQPPLDHCRQLWPLSDGRGKALRNY